MEVSAMSRLLILPIAFTCAFDHVQNPDYVR
jgi:hypothetical protein